MGFGVEKERSLGRRKRTLQPPRAAYIKTQVQERVLGFSVAKAISRGLTMQGLIFMLSNFALFQRLPRNC